MSWKTLRPQLKTLLDTISTIHETASFPKAKFSGYPAATVTPNENEADYETNTENIRTYSFMVRVFYETKSTGIADAITALEEVIDSVIDTFDQDDLKGSGTRTVGVNLPSTHTFINIWATPSAWFELPDEELIYAQIVIRVRISIDIS